MQAGIRFIYLINQGLDAVVWPVHLAGRLIPLRHYSFDLPEVDEDVTVALTLVVSDYHFTLFVFVLGVKGVLLYFAQGLLGFLFCALYRDAVEGFRIHLN